MKALPNVNRTFGIIVPTRGERIDYLKDCIESIKQVPGVFLALVAPKEKQSEILSLGLEFDLVVDDPRRGLAAAINEAESQLPDHIEYFNWLGDDDLLEFQGIQRALNEISNSPDCPFTFGNTWFIDAAGKTFGSNTFGRGALKILLFGPNKIPQPGAVIRRSAFLAIGKLNESLKLAFDFDMFIRLSKFGKAVYVPEFVAKYRWHAESLSASQTYASIEEASRVRSSNLPLGLRKLSRIWETLHVLLAKSRAQALTKKAQRNWS